MNALRALISMTHTIILLGVMLEMQTFLQFFLQTADVASGY